MSTNAAINPMGFKRICTNCSGRFYDLNKRPIICPECNTEFTGEVKTKTRRGRNPAEAKKDDVAVQEIPQKEEGEILEEDLEVEVVSLDDADTIDTNTIIEDDEEIILVDEDPLDDLPDLPPEDAADLGDEEILLDDDE